MSPRSFASNPLYLRWSNPTGESLLGYQGCSSGFNPLYSRLSNPTGVTIDVTSLLVEVSIRSIRGGRIRPYPVPGGRDKAFWFVSAHSGRC